MNVAAGATVEIEVLFDNSLGDIDALLRFASDPNCGTGSGTGTLVEGFSSTDNETLTWTNNTGACAENLALEVSVYDSPSNANCNTYDLIVRNIGSCNFNVDATRFCDPMNANFTGTPTILHAISLLPFTEISLQASSGPVGQFGYFLVNSATNEPGISLGSGRFCLGAPFGRFNINGPGGVLNSLGQFNTFGTLVNSFSNGDPGNFHEGFLIPDIMPFAGSPTVQPGSTWHYQLWHREAGGDSNFSNGLSVTFPFEESSEPS